MKLSSKPEVVVVTGASAGLGRAIFREFAREGASVGLLARGRERLEETRREAEALGGRAIVLTTDVADAEAAERAAEAVELEFVRDVIIQAGSALAYRSIPLQSAYCGAKHPVVGFTDSIRSESMRDIIGARSALTYRLHGKKKTRMTKKKRTKAGSFFSSHYRLCQ